MYVKSFSLIILVSLFLLSTSNVNAAFASLTFEDSAIDSVPGYNKVVIGDWWGLFGTRLEVDLIEHDEYNIINMKDKIRLTLSDPIENPLESLRFRNETLDYIPFEGKIQEEITQLVLVSVPNYIENCSEEPYINNKTGKTLYSLVCKQVQNGSRKEYQAKTYIEDYNPSKIYPAGVYYFYISADRTINKKLDWVITSMGIPMESMAWWNVTWPYKKQVNITGPIIENTSVTLSFQIPANMNTTFNSLRFVNGTENEELPFYIDWSNSTWINVSVRVKNNNSFYMYYALNLTYSGKSNLTTGKSDLLGNTNKTALTTSATDAEFKGVSFVTNTPIYITEVAQKGTSNGYVRLYDSGKNIIANNISRAVTKNGDYYYPMNYPLAGGTLYYVQVNSPNEYYVASAFGTGTQNTLFNATHQTYGNSLVNNDNYQIALMTINAIRRYTGTYVIGGEEEPAVVVSNTCTYSGTGDWNMLCSDYCNISTNVNLGGNKLIIQGTGKIILTANITNFASLWIQGNSSTDRCNVYCTGGNCFRKT